MNIQEEVRKLFNKSSENMTDTFGISQEMSDKIIETAGKAVCEGLTITKEGGINVELNKFKMMQYMFNSLDLKTPGEHIYATFVLVMRLNEADEKINQLTGLIDHLRNH